MKIETKANNLLKKILQMNFTKSRVVYYKTEIRKVGLYEDIDDRVEYLNSLERKIEREYKRKIEKSVQYKSQTLFILYKNMMIIKCMEQLEKFLNRNRCVNTKEKYKRL